MTHRQYVNKGTTQAASLVACGQTVKLENLLLDTTVWAMLTCLGHNIMLALQSLFPVQE